ncbi:MAG TPA: PQQ-binding-like beta-propeller repeat protein [Tepidisphaeraceae bacterium]|nr:PQQ-binding-like beta-propeller repeat protein [Tepidisphaeraceae bacterium]
MRDQNSVFGLIRLAPAFLVLACLQSSLHAAGEKQFSSETKLVARMEGCGGVCVEFSRDGKALLTAGNESARVWDAATFKPVTEPLYHGKGLTTARFSGDARKVLTVGDSDENDADKSTIRGRGARVWDALTGRQLLSIPTHGQRPVFDAAINMDGSRVATAAQDDNVACIWNTTTRQIDVRLNCRGPVLHVAFRPDSNTVMTIDQQDGLRQWDGKTGLPIGKTIAAKPFPRRAAYSANGKILVIGSDAYFAVFDAATGELKNDQDVENAQRAVFNVAASGDGRVVAIAASAFYGAQVWDAETGLPIVHPTITGDDRCILSGDGKLVIYRGVGDVAGMWDVTRNKRIQTFNFGSDFPNTFEDACFSPDDRRIAVTGSVGDGITLVFSVTRNAASS